MLSWVVLSRGEPEGVGSLSGSLRPPRGGTHGSSPPGTLNTSLQRLRANGLTCGAAGQRLRGVLVSDRESPLTTIRSAFGHTAPPSNSQEESVTRRSVLAVPWPACYCCITCRRMSHRALPGLAATGSPGRAASANSGRTRETADGRRPPPSHSLHGISTAAASGPHIGAPSCRDGPVGRQRGGPEPTT